MDNCSGSFMTRVGLDHNARGLFVDDAGGVFVTGTSDPDGNLSNFNDQFFTVKRNAATGALLWTNVYGQTCIQCFDQPSDVRVDPEGHVFVVGKTSSPPFVNEVILLVLDTATGLETNRGLVFNVGSEIPFPGALRFDAAFNIYNGGGINNADTGATDMSMTKWASLIGGGGGIPCEDLRFLPGALQVRWRRPANCKPGLPSLTRATPGNRSPSQSMATPLP